MACVDSESIDDSSLHSRSPGLCEETTSCPLCHEKLKQPKVLNCLHVACLPCLEVIQQKMVKDGSFIAAPTITCPNCKQETPVPAKGLSVLPSDLVDLDSVEPIVTDDTPIVCTSCRAREKAVARCTDCANFLCGNCVTAHQFMRCFDNHKVVSLEDLQKGEGVVGPHKPLLCSSHSGENLMYFCNTCQIPICNECTVSEHTQVDHHYERIEDLQEKKIEDLKLLLTESKEKIESCEEADNSLQTALSELELQRDNAKGSIQETFQSYKVTLENRQADLLKELDELHATEELSIMEMSHNIQKTIEKIENGCRFTERIMEKGSTPHVLALKRVIEAQLLSLINNTPKPEIKVALEFYTVASVFEDAVKKTFGSFSKEEAKQADAALAALHLPLKNDVDIHLPPDLNGIMMPPIGAHDFIPQMPPIGPAAFNRMHSMPAPIGTPITGASRTEICISRNSHSPTMSDSGISMDAASTNSASSLPLVNLSVLSKLGQMNLNDQGQLTMKGQMLSRGTVSVMPPYSSSNRAPTHGTDVALGGMFSPTPRAQTPTLQNTLASFLNPNTSSFNSQPGSASNTMSNIGTFNTMALGEGGSEMSDYPTGPMSSSSNLSSGSGGYPCSTTPPYPPLRRGNKMSAMQIRCKFGQLGPGKSQFNSPHGFCLGLEEDIIVADTNNHRIQVFEKAGEFKYQFGIPGREEGQLWYPRKVAVMRLSGKYVVCDRGNERSRMQIFSRNGHFVKKIAIRYIDIVAGLAITDQGHILAVDSVSPTVFCISENGDLIKWFDCSDYMREPSDIAISGKEYFVCDFKGHCVVVFNEDGQFMRRIGCENITNYPNGIDISDAGDVLIGDSHGNRFHVGVFQRDGSLIGEFECPYVKVSRCCGLKITSEGYVVTLAKNNHHVLVLNTLYIT